MIRKRLFELNLEPAQHILCSLSDMKNRNFFAVEDYGDSFMARRRRMDGSARESEHEPFGNEIYYARLKYYL